MSSKTPRRQAPNGLRHVARAARLCGWLAAVVAPVVMSANATLAAEITLQDAVHAPTRTAENVARDPARHPLEELGFFGITPQSKVIEIWPGGGYWTEILAPYLHDGGEYHMAVDVPDGVGQNFALWPAVAARLDADPKTYGRVQYDFFGQKHIDLAAPNSADMVLTFRNLHNWMKEDDVMPFLASIHRALKSGGILGVEEHRANTRTPQDPKAKNGYVRQDYAINVIEKAGFKFVGASEVDANPRDTADWPKGVWTLPPTYALGAVDHAKYEEVGEADNFVLKFIKRD